MRSVSFFYRATALNTGRAQMSNELSNVSGGPLAQRPDYMQDVSRDDYGTSVLEQYVSPPFIKIVQDNSKEPYNNYASGTVLAVPLNQELFAPRQIFHITPVFFFSEYVLTNPFPLKHLPFIRERSFDPKGEIADKCRDFANRSVICPEAPADKQDNDKFKCVYYEHLNYVCIIWEHDVFRVSPIIFTFRSGEFKTGKKLAGLIHMRDAAICSMRFQACTSIHTVSGNDNWGFDFDNPNPDADGGLSPWLPEEEYKFYREIHNKFKEMYSRGELQPTYDKETTENSAPADAPAM